MTMESMDFKENSEASAIEDKYRIVICGANAYDKKYYFNKKFDRLPENIKEELHIICVLFTEECGGVFTISFTPFGHVLSATWSLIHNTRRATFSMTRSAPVS